MRHRKSVIVFAWILSALMFSFVYWFTWRTSPDSFILNKEFNLTPYEQLTDKLWSQRSDAIWDHSSGSQSTPSIELDELYKRVKELNREAASAQIQLSALEHEQAAIELAAQTVYAEHSAKLWSNVEKYKRTAIAVESAEVEKMTIVTDALASVAQTLSSPAANVAIANARVELARRQYTLAVKNAAVSEYVLQHLRELADPDTTAKFEATKQKLVLLRKEQSDLVEKLHVFRTRAFKLLEEWYSTRTERLEWIDFLYFSVGVSTTTTFGDIIPNSRVVRVSALIQLIFSLLLVGYLVSLLGHVRSKP